MTNVFIAIYEHRHVADARVFATEAGARAWKDELAREHWSDHCEGEPPSEGAGDAYFEAAGDYGDSEFFSLEEHPIQGALTMNTEKRIEIERKIVAFLYNAMAAAGWQVDYIFDGQDNVRYAEWTEAKVLDTVFSVDDATVSFVKPRPGLHRSVYLILGNSGWDCINDHACSDPNIPDDNFEAVMKLVDTFAEQFQET